MNELNTINTINTINNKIISLLVKHFIAQDMFSDEELEKYYLDQTGNYLPKLKE